MIHIKNRWTGEVIRAVDATNLYSADLRGADLHGADLCGANLCNANLREANLYGANLREAHLRRADLYKANLRGADLYRADLCEAHLRGADLYGADLCEANLCEADLHEAHLRGADLRRVYIQTNQLFQASWGKVSPELCNQLMLLDAESIPNGMQLMTDWASGGTCPLKESSRYNRVARFTEHREEWDPNADPMTPWEIWEQLSLEKDIKISPRDD